jgi:hypothetical protein
VARKLRVLAPIALVAFAASAVTFALAFPAPVARSDEGEARQPAEPAPSEEPIRCVQPAIEIPETPLCGRGRRYPHCKWQLPDARVANRAYRVWRNTTPEHRWGRPGLVSLVLATAAEYQRRWPGEQMQIGDLDAPGPRHRTHDNGVDVDLYLPHAMMTRSEGGRRYVDNYANRPAEEVAGHRARVMDLAHILATCARGQIRIYYNDPEIITPFLAWFSAQNLSSSVGAPMEPHNELHEFHFHLTIPEDFEPLPTE